MGAAIVPPDRLINWQADLFRFTAFLGEPPTSTEGLWANVMGSEPAMESTQRAGAVKTYIAESPHEDGFLTLYVQGNKVDWVYAARPALHTPTGVPYMCSLKEGLGAFGPIIERVLGTSPGMATTRLAFGATLMSPVLSREEGYRLLDRLLPDVKLDPEGSSDFVYRINRRRPSKAVDGLEINRLSEWIVARFVNPEDAAAHSGGGVPTSYAARLVLDVNSAPEHTESLTVETQSELLAELRDLALEIAKDGDIK